MKLNKLLVCFLLLFVFSLNMQAEEAWNEFVTVSEFNVQPVCWYKGKASQYDRSYGERRVYAFHIKSKYRLFHHYNELALVEYYGRRARSYHEPIAISTKVYNVYASSDGANGEPQLIGKMQNNKEDFYFYLEESDIEKLVGEEGFKVYLPRHIFDQALTKKLYKKHFNNRQESERVTVVYMAEPIYKPELIKYYAHLRLDSSNTTYYTKVCSEQIQKSKEDHEKLEREKILLEEEKSKPVNRIKSLFGA